MEVIPHVFVYSKESWLLSDGLILIFRKGMIHLCYLYLTWHQEFVCANVSPHFYFSLKVSLDGLCGNGLTGCFCKICIVDTDMKVFWTFSGVVLLLLLTSVLNVRWQLLYHLNPTSKLKEENDWIEFQKANFSCSVYRLQFCTSLKLTFETCLKKNEKMVYSGDKSESLSDRMIKVIGINKTDYEWFWKKGFWCTLPQWKLQHLLPMLSEVSSIPQQRVSSMAMQRPLLHQVASSASL